MKRLFMFVACVALMGSVAHAATIDVPSGSYTTIQAAINAASDGDTVNIISNGPFQEDLIINKRVNVTATAGLSPVIQCGRTTTTAQLEFRSGASGTKFGSLTGGRITVQYRKQLKGVLTGNYSAMVRFNQAQGTAVTMENVTLNESGATSNSYAVTVIIHENIANTVNLKNVDIDASHSLVALTSTDTDTVTGLIQNHAIRIGAEWNEDAYTNVAGGPTYNLDHVRYKNYNKAGLMPVFANARINMSYCDGGVILADTVAGSSRPWGSIYSGRLDAPWSGQLDHCIFRGAGGSNNVWLSSNGTSVTMSRCVLLGKYIGGSPTSTYGNLYLGGANGNGVAGPGVVTLTADHCDFVDLTTLNTTFYGAITRPNATNLAIALSITNSNIYSLANGAVTMPANGTGDTFISDYNNVFGLEANSGYTAGAHDKSKDPGYVAPLTGDVRYTENSIKFAASDGGPIGVNADYSDPVKAIIAGEPGVNRAHGWAILK